MKHCLEEAGREGRAVITPQAALLQAYRSHFASFEEQLLKGGNWEMTTTYMLLCHTKMPDQKFTVN